MNRKRGSGGNGVAIFAMILAIGSLALSGYMYTLISEPSESEAQTITQIWYDSRESAYSCSSSFTDVTDLELIITVNAGEKVYILFNGEFTVSSGTTGGGAKLKIDDTAITDSEQEFYSDGNGLNHWDSVTLQYIATGLSAGTHTIKIQAVAMGGAGTVQHMTLFAYTFP